MEYLVQRLSDAHGYNREMIAVVVTACFHYLSEQVNQADDPERYIKVITRYVSDSKKGTGSYWQHMGTKDGVAVRKKVRFNVTPKLT